MGSLRLLRLLWVLHIGGVILWGAALLGDELLPLAARSVSPADRLLLASAYRLGVALSEPLTLSAYFLTVISGALSALLGPWGLFRWYWLMVKYLLTAFLIFTGEVFLGPARVELAALAARGFDVSGISVQAALWRRLHLAVLFLLLVISHLKPWGKVSESER